ncbi:MAG: L,D-transpeptidase [Nocardioidaceae bacterium]|nr:L,D-transpeptidase [Nocardioidaceae bacterium]
MSHLRRGRHAAGVRLRWARGAMLATALLMTLAVAVTALALGPRSAVVAAPERADDVLQPLAWAGDVHDRASSALRDAVAPTPTVDPTALPARTGQGRRVVFDRGAQRVWLVRGNGSVARTYPVSGSVHDNLDAGRYRVYSRSARATSFDYSSTMGYFVRFTRGANAAIGFHDIPVDDDGQKVQTRSQLGTALSSGCIRQLRPDAKAMWRFAPVGTLVVVR